MLPPFHETKTGVLERQIATLLAEIASAEGQWHGALAEVDRNRIDRQLNDLNDQLEKKETELAKLQGNNSASQTFVDDWQIYLPRINFKEVVAITNDLLLDCSKKCAALFLIPDSLKMGGKWCVSRMRDLLEGSTSDFRHIELECTSTSQFSEEWFLDNLARYLKGKSVGDDRETALELVKTLGRSLRSGSVLFLEIRGWEIIPGDSEMFTWFVQEFWVPLTRELAMIEASYSRVKIVIVIQADEPLPVGTIPAMIACSRSAFHIEKILKLTLQNWSQEEIHDWLESYSRLTTKEIGKLARKIFNSSASGLPALVYQALNQQLATER